MNEKHFEDLANVKHTDSPEHTEPVDSAVVQFEEEEEGDSLFEESILTSSFSPRSDTDDVDSYEFSEDENDLVDYNSGDLVDLRGLFDEDAVDPLKNGTTLDFEEIPDDIDIDEPIEIEKLSRFGKIMNVVILATLIVFLLTVVGFIVNAALVIGAVSSANIQFRTFADVSGLDNAEANVDVTIVTEATTFGRFIKGRIDRAENSKGVQVRVFLVNSDEVGENLGLKDAIMDITYLPTNDLKFDFGSRKLIEMKGISMKLNPHFDASRLSGFIEARNGDEFHKRYPSKIVISLKALLEINSFWVPFPFPVKLDNIEFPMDRIDKLAEELKLAKTKNFDFMPKFIEFAPLVDREPMVLKVRQPIPKFYGPPAFEIAIHIPEMNLAVKQFEMTGNYGPHADPDIKKLFKEDSNKLATAKVKPFVMIMSDVDPTPNILNIEAQIEATGSLGLMRIVSAIRDNTINNMGFLFAPTTFNPDEGPRPIYDYSENTFEGVSFLDFMKTFWGRQAYPSGDGSGPALPSVPELYDPEIDSAFNIKFNGFNVIESPTKILNLSFLVRANTHYVISQYNLPLLMISGQLPAVDFGFHVKDNFEMKHVARLTVLHHKKESDKEMIFDVQVQILNLDIFSKFALKASRLYNIADRGLDPKTNHVPSLNSIQGGMLVAISSSSWPSKFVSAFDLEFDFKNDEFGFFYKHSRKPILKDFPKPVNSVLTSAGTGESQILETGTKNLSESTPKSYNRLEETKVIKELMNLLDLDEQTVSNGDVPVEAVIVEEIQNLKRDVVHADDIYNQRSSDLGNFNMSIAGKDIWQDKLDPKSENSEQIITSVLIEEPESQLLSQLSGHQKIENHIIEDTLNVEFPLWKFHV